MILAKPELVYESRAMKNIIEKVQYVAKMDTSIVIYGETGVGKTALARYIHNNSSRYSHTFEDVNCAAIPEPLIESELFGYEKGAFTGANVNGKLGRFDVADKGTLFLDEIGEASLSLQSKLLHFLDTGMITKVGGAFSHYVDVRIISATNKNLFEMIKDGRFREDLYYRLNIFPILMPPLRERQEDILKIGQNVLDRLNEKYNTKKFFSEKLKTEFQKYSWPGNIRQLNNIVERLYALSGEKDTVDVGLLTFSFDDSKAVKRDVPRYQQKEGGGHIKIRPLKEYVHDAELSYIYFVLEKCGGSVSKAAKVLGVHRTSLYKKLENGL